MNSILEKIQKLRIELKEMENAYYSGNSIENDEIYDFKLRTLVELENQYPEYLDKDSPTQKVGFYREDNLTDVHEEPMLSLNNAFNQEDLENFFNNCSKNSENVEYILEPKIDGASISLIYIDGYLHKALSRGNGETGEDLTSKILYIPEIPIHISNLPKKVIIRGEIYIKKSDFKKLQHQNNKAFANHRNFVAGSLRLKKSSELSKKKLKLRAYQILYPENLGIKTQKEALETIKKWGFETHEDIFISSNAQDIYEYIKKFGDNKNNSDIPCDGIVLKVNNLSVLEEIGYTSKFPKWAIAYKYPSTIKNSKLLEIFPTVGRTGKITYSAKVEPIEIDGSTVQYATLHNANYIMDLDLRVGDYVNIYKSGEIVPRIIGFSQNKRTEGLPKWIPCENCPSCKSKLVTRENLATQFCENENCLEKTYAQLSHWASKSAADIEGLSTNIIIKFSKIGILNSIDDIYNIKNHKELILNSDLKIKEKLFEKIVSAIEVSKNREFKNLLVGLGINFMGEEGAAEISKKYKNIDDLMNAPVEDIEKINGVGSKCANSISQWFKKEKNMDLIKKLKNLGLFKNLPSEKKKIIENFLTEKKIVITGRLSKPRQEFSKMLEETYGAIICKDISSKVNLVIYGEEAGSKLQSAQQKNIETIDEKSLLNRLGIT